MSADNRLEAHLIRPPERGHIAEMRLRQRGDGSVLAAWVERDVCPERIAWRTLGGAGPAIQAGVAATRGAAGELRICGDPRGAGGLLVWTQWQDAGGVLCECRCDVAGAEAGQIAALDGVNCGRSAAARGADGGVWLVVEAWNSGTVDLLLLREAGGGWTRLGSLTEGGFAVRPRLAAAGDGLLATWDAYTAEGYRVHAATIGAGGVVGERGVLPCPEACWETLTSPLATASGRRLVARCRECLAQTHPGTCGHHSEIVVAERGDGAWRDILSVNVDHAMNPWMAAYWGFRRFPMLMSLGGRPWLLWEEKEDIASMDPCYGRLCGMRIAHGGEEEDRPGVVWMDKACLFAVAESGEDALWIAAKRPPMTLERHLPYKIARVSLEQTKPRPAEPRDSNAAAATFHPSAHSGRRAALSGGDLKLFHGDPHIHSRFSQDLDGEQDELYHFARDVAGLDFVALTENDHTRFNEPLYAAEWRQSLRNAEFFNRPGEFTTFVGWEFTMCARVPATGAPISHRSVIFPDRCGPVYPCHDGRTPGCPSLARRFHGRPVLLHHHHPMGYDITDDTVVCNIEVCSGWWNCMRIPEFVDRLHELLNRGHRLGFIGGSDNHERNPGLGGAITGVWAEANTREALFDAFRARRVFATTGLRPDLRFEVGGTFMGGRGVVRRCPGVSVHVCCDAPILEIELIRDGQCVASESFDTTEVAWTWTDRHCAPGDHWYYAHVRFAGGHPDLDWSSPEPLPWNVKPARGVDAWTSPVWIHHVMADEA